MYFSILHFPGGGLVTVSAPACVLEKTELRKACTLVPSQGMLSAMAEPWRDGHALWKLTTLSGHCCPRRKLGWFEREMSPPPGSGLLNTWSQLVMQFRGTQGTFRRAQKEPCHWGRAFRIYFFPYSICSFCFVLVVEGVSIWAECSFASLYQFSSQARTRSLSQPHFSHSGNPAILTQITKLIICVYIWSAGLENINHTLNDQGKVWRSEFCAAFELRFKLFYSSPC